MPQDAAILLDIVLLYTPIANILIAIIIQIIATISQVPTITIVIQTPEIALLDVVLPLEVVQQLIRLATIHIQTIIQIQFIIFHQQLMIITIPHIVIIFLIIVPLVAVHLLDHALTLN